MESSVPWDSLAGDFLKVTEKYLSVLFKPLLFEVFRYV